VSAVLNHSDTSVSVVCPAANDDAYEDGYFYVHEKVSSLSKRIYFTCEFGNFEGAQSYVILYEEELYDGVYGEKRSLIENVKTSDPDACKKRAIPLRTYAFGWQERTGTSSISGFTAQSTIRANQKYRFTLYVYDKELNRLNGEGTEYVIKTKKKIGPMQKKSGAPGGIQELIYKEAGNVVIDIAGGRNTTVNIHQFDLVTGKRSVIYDQNYILKNGGTRIKGAHEGVYKILIPENNQKIFGPNECWYVVDIHSHEDRTHFAARSALKHKVT
jgi:hypothetical protein